LGSILARNCGTLISNNLEKREKNVSTILGAVSIITTYRSHDHTYFSIMIKVFAKLKKNTRCSLGIITVDSSLVIEGKSH